MPADSPDEIDFDLDAQTNVVLDILETPSVGAAKMQTALNRVSWHQIDIIEDALCPKLLGNLARGCNR